MESELLVANEPELYDIFNFDCIDDISMYMKLFKNCKSVLELGVGTGRIAIPLANSGIRVIGIDKSNSMLSCLKNKLENNNSSNIILYQQDFCDLSITDDFDIAYYPFCTFNYLLSIKEQKKALISLKKYLSKDKIIIFDLLTINTFKSMLYDHSDYNYNTVTIGEFDIGIYTRQKFDQSNQLFIQERNFKYFIDNNFVSEKRVKMLNRVFFIGEFELLLDLCGYQIVEKYGDYKFNKFTNNSTSLIIIAKVKD